MGVGPARRARPSAPHHHGRPHVSARCERSLVLTARTRPSAQSPKRAPPPRPPLCNRDHSKSVSFTNWTRPTAPPSQHEMSCTALLWSGVVDLSFPNKSAFLNVYQCALLLFGATPDRPGQFSGSPRISTVFATRWAMPLPDCSAQGRRCRSVDHEVELLLHPEPRLRDRKGSQGLMHRLVCQQ